MGTYNSVIMKLCLVLLSVLCMGCMSANLLQLIQKEVHALLMADSTLDVDGCTQKCDDMFDLIAGTDESDSDRACHYACAHAINGNQHTRPTHHTRPHHTRPQPTSA